MPTRIQVLLQIEVRGMPTATATRRVLFLIFPRIFIYSVDVAYSSDIAVSERYIFRCEERHAATRRIRDSLRFIRNR